MVKWESMKIKELKEKYPLLPALGSCIWNLGYALFLFVLSFSQKSYWYFTLGMFFLATGVMRLSAFTNMKHLLKVNGVVMLFLAVVIAGMNYLTIHERINPQKAMAFAIAQAAFTFAFLGIALAGLWKMRKKEDQKQFLLRNVSLASAISSLLGLQRTMLGTFGDPMDSFTLQMEAATGMGAFLLLLVLSVGMIIAKEETEES